MPNNVVTSHSLIVRTAMVNDPGEIIVCLQKDAKQCCDIAKVYCNLFGSDQDDEYIKLMTSLNS